MKLEGAVAFVTGASSGIGRETALALARSGCKVAVGYNKGAAAASAVVKQCQLHAPTIKVKIDITSETSVKRALTLVRKFGAVSILINNAGILVEAPFAQQTFKQLQAQINVNLLGTMRVTHTFLTLLLVSNEAVIVNVGSVISKEPYVNLTAYCASKYGVRGFTQTLALELPSTIRVYCLNPGLTATAMTDFEGIRPSKVAEVIVRTVKETLRKTSGDDIDVPDYV